MNDKGFIDKAYSQGKTIEEFEEELKIRIKNALTESIEAGSGFLWTEEMDKIAKDAAHGILQQAIDDFKKATEKDHPLVLNDFASQREEGFTPPWIKE